MFLKIKQTWLVLAVIFAFAIVISAQNPIRVESIQMKSNISEKLMPYNVILPKDYEISNTRYPVLYLLHGLFGRYDNWITHSNIADYAAKYRIIVVMPEGGDGWYSDSATIVTDKYETYFFKELIPDVDNRYRTIQDRRGRAIAGLSMGGYGALKFGVKHSEMFVLAASTSGALDPALRSQNNQGFGWSVIKLSILKVFGDEGSKTRTENDLHQLVKNLSNEKLASLPYFYLDCGTDDGWLASNHQLADIFLERKIPHEFRQLPGGHDWGYWDARVQYILALANDKLSANPTSIDR